MCVGANCLAALLLIQIRIRLIRTALDLSAGYGIGHAHLVTFGAVEQLRTEVQSFEFGCLMVQVLVPDADALKAMMTLERMVAFSYWAKIWPSAIALCRYIALNPDVVAGKNVLELAAGLGLPGMLAAQIASEVSLSDFAVQAVDVMKASVQRNGLENVHCIILDWNQLPADVGADVLLLSDINYDPAAFEVLFGVLLNFLNRGTTILLATPQRLMAKPFIERLLPYCAEQREELVLVNGEQAYISVLMLKLN